MEFTPQRQRRCVRPDYWMGMKKRLDRDHVPPGELTHHGGQTRESAPQV